MKRVVGQSFVVWLLVFLPFLLCSTVFADDSMIAKRYSFERPNSTSQTLMDGDGCEHQFVEVSITGCRTTGFHAGEPRLPVKGICLALPQGQMADRIEIEAGQPEVMAQQDLPAPQQAPYPLSKPERAHYTPPRTAIYEGTRLYPESLKGVVNFQRCKGYNLVYTTVHPVQWDPSANALLFYSDITVTVYTKPLSDDYAEVLCRGLESDRRWVARMVDNPEQLDDYRAETATRDNYTYVIITNQAFANAGGANSFVGLAQHKTSFGQTTHIETTENIYATYVGSDNQAKIRNFIIYAYNNWNTEFVVLGGDGDVSTAGGEAGNSIVPPRGFYVSESGYVDTRIPSDMYYSNLDGTFNNDNDTRWGEPTDGPGGGEVDLAAEVYVGRYCVDSELELNRMVAKTIDYETTSSDAPWLKQAYMLGELLWSDDRTDRETYGCDYKDEVKFGSSMHGYTTAGFPDDWTVGTLYDRDLGSWGSSQLLPVLNSNNLHVINHLGHADVDYNMRIYNAQADAITSTNPWLGYTQGCLSGAFDDLSDSGSSLTYDCIMEHLTVNDCGPFAYVGNARYGWGAYDSTDGASQYFDRQFFDAIFGEEILNLGKVQADSKEDTIPYINVDCHRWCYYELNLFGDPHTIFGGGVTRDGIIQLDRSVYPMTGAVTIQVTDLDLNVNASVPDAAVVTIATDSGDEETVNLVETAAASCVFTGQINLSSATTSIGNGSLEVTHECTITATYIDSNTGHGGVNIPKTAQAQVDGVIPTISDITIVSLNDTQAVISWATDEPSDSIVTYGITQPFSIIRIAAMTRLHLVTIPNLTPCTYYHFTVGSTDNAGNEAYDDNQGRYYGLTTWERSLLLEANMDTNPGWVSSGGQWAWGVPTGQGGEHGCPDPTSGFTGNQVYGYNLNGDYPNSMTRYNLTMGPIDCSVAQASKIQFRRWLGVERNQYDHATFEVSTDGLTWVVLWANGTESIADGQWLLQEFDVASIVDSQPNVYFRWSIGPTDTGWMYCGWNIDDVKFFYSFPCDIPTPTPIFTDTPEPTATTMPSATPTPDPSNPPTATIVPPTPTPIPQADPQIHLVLNQDVYRAEDPFLLSMRIDNEFSYATVDQYIILDVIGSFYFHPQWTTSIAFTTRTLDPAQPVQETILAFQWPSGAGSAQNIRFWSALFEMGSFTMIGDIEMCSFDFE